MRRWWTNEEIALLERYYPSERMTPTKLEEIFERNWGAIRVKAISLGLSRSRPDAWTQDKIALLEQYYPEGRVTSDEMEEIFDRSWKAIQSKAQRLGLSHPRFDQKEWTQEEVITLEQCYSNEQVTPQEMEELFNRSWYAIKWKARKLGLRCPERNIYHADRSYFRHITTERAAYWLGLLAADGSVKSTGGQYTIILSLNNRDRKLVEDLRDDITPGAPIYKSNNNACRFQIASKEMVEDLSRYNIVQNKTDVFTWPRMLPDELTMAFLLGYFDGDGSLCQCSNRGRRYWQWSLLGTQLFLNVAREYIQRYAQVEIGEPRRACKDRSPHLYIIRSGKQDSVVKIDRILNTSGFGLARKHFQR